MSFPLHLNALRHKLTSCSLFCFVKTRIWKFLPSPHGISAPQPALPSGSWSPLSPSSPVAGPIRPIWDPEMSITLNFFHGNVFFIVRKDKLAWLLHLNCWAFLRIQDGGRHYLGCWPISKFWSRWPRGLCNTSFQGFSRVWSPFLELFFWYRVKVKDKMKVKGQTKKILRIVMLSKMSQRWKLIFESIDLFTSANKQHNTMNRN